MAKEKQYFYSLKRANEHRKCEGCAAPAAAIYILYGIGRLAGHSRSSSHTTGKLQIIRRACCCSARAQHKKTSQGWFITRLMNEVLFGAKPDAKQILAGDTRVYMMRAQPHAHNISRICARERNVY